MDIDNTNDDHILTDDEKLKNGKEIFFKQDYLQFDYNSEYDNIQSLKIFLQDTTFINKDLDIIIKEVEKEIYKYICKLDNNKYLYKTFDSAIIGNKNFINMKVKSINNFKTEYIPFGTILSRCNNLNYTQGLTKDIKDLEFAFDKKLFYIKNADKKFKI